jgi:hypothetical protein
VGPGPLPWSRVPDLHLTTWALPRSCGRLPRQHRDPSPEAWFSGPGAGIGAQRLLGFRCCRRDSFVIFSRGPRPNHSAECGSHRRGLGVYTGAGGGALEGGCLGGSSTCVRTCDRTPDNCRLQGTTHLSPKYRNYNTCAVGTGRVLRAAKNCKSACRGFDSLSGHLT